VCMETPEKLSNVCVQHRHLAIRRRAIQRQWGGRGDDDSPEDRATDASGCRWYLAKDVAGARMGDASRWEYYVRSARGGLLWLRVSIGGCVIGPRTTKRFENEGQGAANSDFIGMLSHDMSCITT
jgi:hypothetical protein